MQPSTHHFSTGDRIIDTRDQDHGVIVESSPEVIDVIWDSLRNTGYTSRYFIWDWPITYFIPEDKVLDLSPIRDQLSTWRITQ